MANDPITVEGVQETLKALGATAEDIDAATMAAIWQEGLDILGKSVKIVPVDTGALRQSAYAAPPKDGFVEIGYGKDYALPVHDKTEVFHPHGEALYLQKPLHAAQRGYTQRVAKRVAANWKRGVKPGQVHSEYPQRVRE